MKSSFLYSFILVVTSLFLFHTVKFDFIYLFDYLFKVRHLSLETDKIYPSTSLLLTLLLRNNEICKVKDEKPNLKHAKFSCFKHAKFL